MSFNFALILVLLTFVSGVITFIDKVYWSKHRSAADSLPIAIEYARSFFPILLIVLLLRSFVFEPYRIPSGSLEPTLLVGDFIVVNKYDYGLRLPVSNNKIIKVGEPQRGDIAVFRWPPNPSIDYIKRIVGIPGDHIQYKNKQLTINGREIKQTLLGYETDIDATGRANKVEKRQETINGITHNIYVRPDIPATDFDVTVPEGQYFAMGDNRDDSSDSRFWGFMPEENLVGKAVAIWMSWDGLSDSIRWRRMGSKII